MAEAELIDAGFTRQEGAQYWYWTPASGLSIACAGLAHREPPMEVTPRTTFHCFSTTKPVTALAVLQLVAEGRIDLDTPVTAYLPDIPYRNGATVRQILSHQAGLPNPLPLAWVHADDDAGFDELLFLDSVFRSHSRCAMPGRRSRYSNIGFLLLGRLIEVVAGRPYAELVRERILDRVGCADARTGAYLGFDIPQDGHATGYTRRWSGPGLFIGLLPDPERLRSSRGGWIQYRPFHLNGAAYGGLKGNILGWGPLLTALAARDRRLLPGELYDAFFAPQVLTSGVSTGHALSWFLGRIAGYEYLCHAGGGPGYGAEIRIYPTLPAASALLTNTTMVSDLRLLDRLDTRWLSSQ